MPTIVSISKSKHAFKDVQANVDIIRFVVEMDWKQRQNDWQNTITNGIKLLVKDILIPLDRKTQSNVVNFENAPKEEMHEDLKYVKSLEKEVDDFQSRLELEKTDFLKEYDLLLQEFFNKDLLCDILLLFHDIDEYSKMACNYLDKIEECERQLSFPRVINQNMTKFYTTKETLH
ncbi:hypothetical protein Tco_0724766 [Tanacetum coccineum]|uniref:Uncharacterized protein n=1 Tax=Tanacetum coccineum TaxID=301880 RepID=A0ABQ4YBV6_9ASTR